MKYSDINFNKKTILITCGAENIINNLFVLGSKVDVISVIGDDLVDNNTH